MNVKVHHFLASIASIIYDNSRAVAKAELSVVCDLTCGN